MQKGALIDQRTFFCFMWYLKVSPFGGDYSHFNLIFKCVHEGFAV